MKSKRQVKILDIIEKYDIDTQDALLDKLTLAGFSVTQATVSRDIRELRLVKTLSESGGYKYSLPPGAKEKNPEAALTAMLRESVETIDNAMNIVVIKSHVGMAMAVCAKLDSVGFHNAVGTLAGDDTIFIAMKTENDAVLLSENLKNLISGR